MSDTVLFKGSGQQVLAIGTTFFTSFLTLRTLYLFTSQRDLLIAVFLIILVYITFAKLLVTNCLCHEESAEFYKLVVKVTNEDRNRKARKEAKYKRERNDVGLKNRKIGLLNSMMYINENDDLIIQKDYQGGEELVYLNKTNPVKQAIIQLFDFMASVIAFVLFSIIVDYFLFIVDTGDIEWHNYVVIYSVLGFLLFVFFVFKHY
jgi:hypothetical protein